MERQRYSLILSISCVSFHWRRLATLSSSSHYIDECPGVGALFITLPAPSSPSLALLYMGPLPSYHTPRPLP